MMYLAKPVIAYDCAYNRHSTENRAVYFKNAADLANVTKTLGSRDIEGDGRAMAEIAHRRYSWEEIGRAYYDLLLVGSGFKLSESLPACER
jgi:glycosyltransferase involved in cell wall biosynthesis